MDIGLLSLLLAAVLFGLLLCGLWVGFALMAVGLVAMEIATSAPVGSVLARRVWGAMNSWDLTALPMFIWMGEILFRSRLSSDMFEGLAPFTRRLPGRLLHVNVFGCALFACVSGSSAATTATVGRMSLPELKARGYDDRLAIGTLAGSRPRSS
jgi:TRAP-type mannitol/chloroaromatic compound transport system permease large subunit